MSVRRFDPNTLSISVARGPTQLGLSAKLLVLTILFAPDGVVGAWQRLVWARLLRRYGAAQEAELIELGAGGGGLLSDRDREGSKSAIDADSAAASERPSEPVEETRAES